jgi:hypothetical protein
MADFVAKVVEGPEEQVIPSLSCDSLWRRAMMEQLNHEQGR